LIHVDSVAGTKRMSLDDEPEQKNRQQPELDDDEAMLVLRD
jgi:hypothetical protein